MKALVIERDLPRFGAARLAGSLRPGSGARFGPLKLDEVDDLTLPNADWVRITPRMSGICGSDLATVDGRSSRWFEPIVSFPFIPGHEVVADTPDGRRVVLEPVLGCVARGMDPVCPACSEGRLGNCERLAHGCLEAGLQTGYCCDTGGGWSNEMIAHPSQLHEVPDELDDKAAVMIEPSACAVHAALSAHISPDETVAVIGAGTLGLLTLAAIDRWSPARRVIVAAKHPHQQALAREFTSNSTEVTCTSPSALPRAVRSAVGTQIIEGEHTESSGWGHDSRLGGGADVTIDCIGSADSIQMALAITRPGGRIVMVGMPGLETIDLTPLWQREISLTGAYTYGTESVNGSKIRTFDLATELVAAADLGRLVSATYALERFADALQHAATAGRLGAVKIAFSNLDPDHRAIPKMSPRKAARR
ncbi:MAG TPA: zinc-binding dehydrogenase [Microthrixaceae bacterium]|nr:zinc-binding dehydrogenase [Microthrixaceae bacterium]